MDFFIPLTREIKGTTCFQNAHRLRFDIPVTCLCDVSAVRSESQGQPGLTVNLTERCGICDAPANMKSTSSQRHVKYGKSLQGFRAYPDNFAIFLVEGYEIAIGVNAKSTKKQTE